MGKPRMILLGPRAPSPAMSAKRENGLARKTARLWARLRASAPAVPANHLTDLRKS